MSSRSALEADARRARIQAGLAAYCANQSSLARDFARHMGMHVTDSAAIVEIIHAEDRGQPLTPARLGELIGLTSGATSILLNRLEHAGHATRVRGHSDRRRVTLHSAKAVHDAAAEYFGPLGAQLDAVMSQYALSQLDLIDGFVDAIRRLGEQDGGHCAHPTRTPEGRHDVDS